MPLRIDLHVHSDSSGDGISSISEIVKIAKAKGLDGVAITDHDLVLDRETAARITRESGILVIGGVEVSAKEGHVLVFDPKRKFPEGTPIQDIVQNALEEGSAVVISHPTDPLSHGVGSVVVKSLSHLRMPLEVLNSSTMHRYNLGASILADELSLPKCGGSDAHLAEAVGDAFTVVEASSCSLEDVVDAIRKGRVAPGGSQTKKSLAAKTVLKRIGKYANLK
ncbi:MAG: PHP domain-containing protein [Candidatus Methanomethylicus sp.]|nr:PHP domain-containing protein [Candidatus Methanomethylicus sp.]